MLSGAVRDFLGGSFSLLQTGKPGGPPGAGKASSPLLQVALPDRPACSSLLRVIVNGTASQWGPAGCVAWGRGGPAIARLRRPFVFRGNWPEHCDVAPLVDPRSGPSCLRFRKLETLRGAVLSVHGAGRERLRRGHFSHTPGQGAEDVTVTMALRELSGWWRHRVNTCYRVLRSGGRHPLWHYFPQAQ